METEPASGLWNAFVNDGHSSSAPADTAECYYLLTESAHALAQDPLGKLMLMERLHSLDSLRQAAALQALYGENSNELLTFALTSVGAADERLRMEALYFLCHWQVKTVGGLISTALSDPSGIVRTAAATWALRGATAHMEIASSSLGRIEADASAHVQSVLEDERDEFDPKQLMPFLKWLDPTWSGPS